MTIEEAIRMLERLQEPEPWEPQINESGFTALEMAIDALKKQMPKKPVMVNKNAEFDGNWWKVCPNCKRILMERITTEEESYPRHYNMTDHCVCGQAIDWR